MADGEIVDCLILGGGPAGLAAGVYMGRYLRPTLILNHPKPMTRWHRPTAHNVLGFPAGIHRNQLLEWGRAHVAKYECVQIVEAEIRSLSQIAEGFELRDNAGMRYRGRGLVIAAGVEHELPEIPGIMAYAGHSVWHCPECDGYKCVDKPVAVVGSDRGSVEMALGLTIWSPQVALCLNGARVELDAECREKLDTAKVSVFSETIRRIVGDEESGMLSGFELAGGRTVELAGAFVNPRCTIASELFTQLPLELHQQGWIRVDHRMRTNIARCYAAGDIVAFAQTQLSVAMGTGATAAIWLHKELLPPGLCLAGREW